MADPHFGTDLALSNGFDPTFPVVSNRANLIDALFRRWTTDSATEAGQEIYQGRCIDIRLLLAGRINNARINNLPQELARVALADDRIAGCAATAEFISATKVLRIAGNLTPGAGPTFPFVLATDGVTAKILEGV